MLYRKLTTAAIICLMLLAAFTLLVYGCAAPRSSAAPTGQLDDVVQVPSPRPLPSPAPASRCGAR